MLLYYFIFFYLCYFFYVFCIRVFSIIYYLKNLKISFNGRCIFICIYFNFGLSCNSLNDLVFNFIDFEWMSGIFCLSWVIVFRFLFFRKFIWRLLVFIMLIFFVKEIIRYVFNRVGVWECLLKFFKYEIGILVSVFKNLFSWICFRCICIYV